MQYDEERNEWNVNHPFFDYTELEFYGTNPDADFDCWSKAPCWTVEEGIALSFGKNPRVVNWAILGSCPGHPFAIEYQSRLDLAVRAKTIGDLQSINRPTDFIRWAKTNGIEFAAELEKAVNQAPKLNVKDLAAEYESVVKERDKLAAELTELKRKARPLLDSERRAMQTIIAAMAKEGYLYASGGNSKVPQEIADDIVKAGLSLDVKTVRKYVHELTQLIPNENPDKP